jgi:hypothetical protein
VLTYHGYTHHRVNERFYGLITTNIPTRDSCVSTSRVFCLGDDVQHQMRARDSWRFFLRLCSWFARRVGGITRHSPCLRGSRIRVMRVGQINLSLTSANGPARTSVDSGDRPTHLPLVFRYSRICRHDEVTTAGISFRSRWESARTAVCGESRIRGANRHGHSLATAGRLRRRGPNPPIVDSRVTLSKPGGLKYCDCGQCRGL